MEAVLLSLFNAIDMLTSQLWQEPIRKTLERTVFSDASASLLYKLSITFVVSLSLYIFKAVVLYVYDLIRPIVTWVIEKTKTFANVLSFKTADSSRVGQSESGSQETDDGDTRDHTGDKNHAQYF